MLPHYPELLRWGWHRRFFTAKQVQRRFGLVSLRTANDQLAQLSKQRLLGQVPIRSILPAHPHVYVTLGRGLRVAFPDDDEAMAAWRQRQDRRARRGYGLQFIDHELAITDMDIAMWESTRDRGNLLLVNSQRRFRSNPILVPHGRRQVRLEPDARYDLIHERHDRRWLDVIFFEEDRGTMDHRRLSVKLNKYQSWLDSGADQYLNSIRDNYGLHGSHPNFRLVIKTRARAGEGNDRDRVAALAKTVLQLSTALQRLIWLANDMDFFQDKLEPKPLEVPTWIRARDFRQFRDQIEQLGEQPGKSIVARELSNFRRYSLLAPA